MDKLIRINGTLAKWNKFCQICGKVEKGRISFHMESGMNLCGKHRVQYARQGKPMEQSRFDKNKIEINGQECRIALNNFRGEISDWCVIDLEDYDKVKDYKWFKRKDGRVVSNVVTLNIGVTHIRIHNIIMNLDESTKYEYEVDHIDCDTLNNRKSNLRIVTKSKNGMNRRIQSNNSTGVTGVVFGGSDYSWMPQIKINRKMIRLGSTNSFDEAVKKRLIAESELFKTHSNNYNFDTDTIQLTYLSHDDNLETFIEVSLDGEILQFKKLKNNF